MDPGGTTVSQQDHARSDGWVDRYPCASNTTTDDGQRQGKKLLSAWSRALALTNGWHADCYSWLGVAKQRRKQGEESDVARVKRYPLCKKVTAVPHKGHPFTCRACGKQACWNCALHYWREKQLPLASAGLEAQRRAIDEAVRGGKLLGCCSTACRSRLPSMYGPDFKLTESSS